MDIDKLLKQKPDYYNILKTLIEYQKVHEPSWHDYDGIEWYDVGISPSRLNYLVTKGILKIVYKSSSHTCYKLVNVEAVENMLKEYEKATTPSIAIDTSAIPKDLFDVVIGYDDIKKVLFDVIRAEKIVGVMLVGPPASAKTLLMMEIARLPKSVYVVGSSLSKPGMIDYLFETKPTYAVIDEIDKMNSKDYSVLLSVAETGIISEMKYGKTRMDVVHTKFFACANTTHRIPAEVLSRFFVFRLKPYTKDEFITTAIGVMVKREGIDKDIAEYIAKQTWEKLDTKDVREAIRIARLYKDKEAIDRFIATKQKYSGT